MPMKTGTIRSVEGTHSDVVVVAAAVVVVAVVAVELIVS